MKKKKSIRKRIFLFMLTISIIPSILITAFATYNTYNALYSQLIVVNRDGIVWSQDRLQQYTTALKNTFYSIESNKQFKNSVMRWGQDQEDYSDTAVMRETLLSCLNQNNQFASIELYLTKNNALLKVERAGATMESGVEKQSLFDRPKDYQTNLYFKQSEGSLYVVHTINRFEDRNMIARLSVRLRTSDLNSVLSKMSTYRDEQVYMFNDEDEVLLSEGDNAQRDKLISQSLDKIRDSRDVTGNFGMGSNIVFHTSADDGKLNLIKIIPRSEIVNATLPTIYMGLLIGFLSLLGSVVLSVMLSLLVSGPIIKLTERVKSIKMESLEMQTSEDTGDEVSVLESHIALFVERIKELIHKEYETKLQAKTAQINALQAQINPHFLHNTLQMIGSIALSKDVREVYNIATALSDILRYSINYESVMVTIQEELAHLDNYFLIQKQRFYDKFTVELLIDEKVKQCLIPKLLIQPIVENSFKHGFERCTDQWHLVIIAYLSEGKVHVIIKDNGAGISGEKLEELDRRLEEDTAVQLGRSEHIGLLNVNARIKLYFSQNDGLQLKTGAGRGTEITLVFDAQSKGEENGIPGSNHR